MNWEQQWPRERIAMNQQKWYQNKLLLLLLALKVKHQVCLILLWMMTIHILNNHLFIFHWNLCWMFAYINKIWTTNRIKIEEVEGRDHATYLRAEKSISSGFHWKEGPNCLDKSVFQVYRGNNNNKRKGERYRKRKRLNKYQSRKLMLCYIWQINWENE